MNYDFREDIKDGEKGEKYVVKHLESNGAKFLNDNKDNKYDVKMIMPSGKAQTFEIKTDVWCIPDKTIELNGVKIPVEGRDNGNLFIETKCRGKESGINVTQANWFVTYFPYLKEMWYIKVADLKELCENNDFRLSTNAGDFESGTKGYLIPRDKYKNEFKVVEVDYEW
jgi:hypothetical protein